MWRTHAIALDGSAPRVGPHQGKSDSIDALAVTRAVLREPDLLVASHDEISRECKLLVDRREEVAWHRAAVTCRCLLRVRELDPSHVPRPDHLGCTVTSRRCVAGWPPSPDWWPNLSATN